MGRHDRFKENGGEGGIRTHGTVSRTLAFEASTFNRSVTSPRRLLLNRNRGLCWRAIGRDQLGASDFANGTRFPRPLATRREKRLQHCGGLGRQDSRGEGNLMI